MASGAQEIYRKLPSVAEVLAQGEVMRLVEQYSQPRVTESVRTVLAGLRERVRTGELGEAGVTEAVRGIFGLVERGLSTRMKPRLRRVVNATGVILQTNLGRAPLSQAAIEHIADVARGYCNLEFDLDSGVRSRRDALVEQLILDVVGLPGHEPQTTAGEPSPVSVDGIAQEASKWGAAAVNNCAAATFLALNTLAEGGEVLVSRGELVEIGGGFLDLRAVGDVELHGVHAVRGARDQVVERAWVARGGDHAISASDRFFRERATEAGRRAGDEPNFTFGSHDILLGERATSVVADWKNLKRIDHEIKERYMHSV